MSATRRFIASRSISAAAGWVRPMPVDRRTNDMAPPLAIMALDGMQSHRWAAPPRTSRSIRVTRAPRRAAAVAAEFPAGPPPMMTNRTSGMPTTVRDGRDSGRGGAAPLGRR